MCNLQRMKVAQNELSFPVPYNNLWQNIKKIIDVFNFKNHTNPNCKDLYNPANFKAAHPNVNTQVGEQTFVWASRFKHIVCAMSKTHHLASCSFYIVWFYDVTIIPTNATKMANTQCYQKGVCSN